MKSRKTDEGRFKEKRGLGRRKEYKPWLRVVEVPSRGRSHRVKGFKTDRVHEFFSDLEEYYFHLVEWNSNVTDIREQFPLLPLAVTQQIADHFGFVHPRNPNTQKDIVMTTDFVVTVRKDGQEYDIARCIKSKKDLESSRVREKLAIEREYWRRKGIDWQVVTEEFAIEKAKNLKMLRVNPVFEMSLEEQNMMELILLKIIELKKGGSSYHSVLEFCIENDNEYQKEHGTSLRLFKYLVFKQRIIVDLDHRLNFSKLFLKGVKVND